MSGTGDLPEADMVGPLLVRLTDSVRRRGLLIPFLVSGKLRLSFRKSYAFGCLALVAGYLAHRVILRTF